MLIRAYQSDGKGGVKVVMIEEPPEMALARLKREKLEAFVAVLATRDIVAEIDALKAGTVKP
jgi:hypothetical protein